jgi:hypothetical protein
MLLAAATSGGQLDCAELTVEDSETAIRPLRTTASAFFI